MRAAAPASRSRARVASRSSPGPWDAAMASLRAKDAYLQSLARKICAQPGPEPPRRPREGKTQRLETSGPPKKKRKKIPKKLREQEQKAGKHKAKSVGEKTPVASEAQRPVVAKEEKASGSTGPPAGGWATGPDSVFALDVLRQRLHEKIQQARGQGASQELSAAVLEKRQRRKQERDRKKRKRKELRARENQEQAREAGAGPEAAAPPEPPGPDAGPPEPALIFSKVEVAAEEPASKAQRRKERRQRVKGNLTPLTGRNYRQLLERLRARRARLDELRGQDAGRARELEARMRWTSLLYKAEGVRVRDSEPRLQEALRRKEKRRAQRRRRWERRSALVVGKMQQRQDLRRRNLRRQRAARAERRLQQARRRGRVLPRDLERAGLA